MGNMFAGGIMDTIRCDEESYLIWKWHPKDSDLGKNKKENSIRWGSSLRVKDGSVAVFVYKQKDGTCQDFIEGPFDDILKTKNLPVITRLIGMAYDGNSPFQAEVYFINMAGVIQLKYGVPFFDVYDPRFLDYGVPVSVRGTLTFNIKDYKEFIKLHRLDDFNMSSFETQVKDAIARYVKSAVTNIPSENNIPVIQLERKIENIIDIIEPQLSKRLGEKFGVNLSGFDISTIEVDKSSEGYKQLMSVTKDIQSATIKAQSEANIKNIHDSQRINAENMEETLRIQREEAQYAQHKQTQQQNMAAFQIEKQAEVGIAGAQALGQMGANGAADLSGGGMNPAGMMAGMAIGGAVGQNVAGMMNNMMGNTMNNQSLNTTPPPMPQTLYNVVINGQSAGPYDVATLEHMYAANQISKDTLVWTNGMENWQQLNTRSELSGVYENSIPPVPQTSNIPPMPTIPPTPPL